MKRILLLPAVLMLAGCAQMEPPPGGPQDLTPPAVEKHHPPAGATGVSIDEELLVIFTEHMNRSSVEEALFLSPALDQPPRLKWRGRTLRIQPKDPLRPDQTYVITLGVGCSDLRNNKMEESYSFAFSTGQAIDQGQISGTVVRADRSHGIGFSHRGGADLWAYRLSSRKRPDPAVDPPDYITQADERGRYRLTHLGPDRYRIFAVEDRNRDRRWNTPGELIGVPSGDLDLSGEILAAVLGPLGLDVADTLEPSLQNARAVHRSAVMLSFDEDVDSARAVSPGAYRIERMDQPGDTLGLLSVSLPPGRSHEIVLSTEEQTEDAAYQVTVRGIIDRAGHAVRTDGGQARFTGAGWADSTGPALRLVWPPDSSGQVALEAEPMLFFDEPVRPASLQKAFSLADTGGTAVEGEFMFFHGAAAAFVPRQPLDPDHWYLLRLEGSSVSDLSGNAMADTSVAVRFETLDAERIGSLSGAIQRGDHAPEAPAVLIVSGPGEKRPHHRHQVLGDDYLLDSLLPGAYTMTAFLDLNGDGLWNPGRPVPFRPAEPLWAADDSLMVRSRWETAGVNVVFQP